MKLGNSFLKLYMDYVEETESPRAFHLWSAISAIGATLGRRAFLPWGPGCIFPNQYILLVGPPATRKNSAINIAKKIISNSTSVRLAPDDTGGKYQGLLDAFTGNQLDEDEEIDALIAEATKGVKLNGTHSGLTDLLDHEVHIDARDAHVLYALASEVSTVVGEKSSTMVKFLVKMFDGEDYTYKLKNSTTKLEEPLLSILGGTNPTDIIQMLPESAIGGGFTSRIILVHATKKYKDIPLPEDLDHNVGAELEDVFRKLYNDFEGEFNLTKEAKEAIKELYTYKTKINDPRFVYYAARRQLHMLKTAMCLAAARLSHTIESADIWQSHSIIEQTEEGMVDAFGEYGLSPLSAARQKLIEFLQHCKAPVPHTALWFLMQKDMRLIDFEATIRDLQSANRIFVKQTKDHGPVIVYIDKEDSLILDFEASAKDDTGNSHLFD